MDWTGAYSGLVGDKGVKEGVQHYKVKITKSLERHQLIGYISIEEKDKQKVWSDLVSRNLLYSEDGTTKTKGITRFSKRAIKEGEVLKCICDIPNGMISWIVDGTDQVIAEAQILPQFRGKEMIPYIGLEDIGDVVEILS